ncbi:MAG TPA: LapA family protein [Prolixibacteraceae bacterium]|nr:LapA family protein [Prolixibacteraceae bacterium]
MENQTPVKKSGANPQLVVILVLAVLLVIFTLQNQEKVTLKVFFWTIREIPVALMLVITILFGYLIPYLLLIPKIWKLKSELTKTRKEKEELEESREKPVRERPVRDPEGVPFDDEEDEQEVDLARKNIAGRLFKE